MHIVIPKVVEIVELGGVHERKVVAGVVVQGLPVQPQIPGDERLIIWTGLIGRHGLVAARREGK